MFFTKDDYKKIADYLSHNLVRDTDFPITNTVKKGDLVPIVQDGENKNVLFEKIITDVLQGNRPDIINLGTIVDLGTALSTISEDGRKPGMVITCYKNKWKIYQFKGITQAEVNNHWNDVSYWEDIHKQLADIITSVINDIHDLEQKVNSNKDSVTSQLNTKVDKVEGKQLSTNDFTQDYIDKIDKAVHDSSDWMAHGKQFEHVYNDVEQLKVDVPKKVYKVEGKDLSSNDYTDVDKAKVDRIGDYIWMRYRGTLEISHTGNNVDYEPLALGREITNNPLPVITDIVSVPFENLSEATVVADTYEVVYNKTLDTFIGRYTPVGSTTPEYYLKFKDYKLYGIYVDNKGVVPYKYGLYFNTTYNTLYRWNVEESTLENFKLDNKVPHLQEQIDRKADKEDLFIDLWNAACGSYGRYNPGTGKFELNGLTDITYEEAINIYNKTIGTWSGCGYAGMSFRTNIFQYNDYLPWGGGYSENEVLKSMFHTNATLEIARVASSEDRIWYSDHAATFTRCPKLRKVIGILGCYGNNREMIFERCAALEHVLISRLYTNVFLGNSPNIDSESLQYMVTNATNTSAITIIVHADVYAKLTDTSNLIWNKILNDASAKNISFVTV